MEKTIEKTVDLSASIERVWHALTDHKEFGKWFRVELEGPFAVGEKAEGNITYPNYEHMRLQVMVKAMERNSLFSYSWCPVADENGNSPLGGVETLVEFKLNSIEGGTRLTISESGFDALTDKNERADALRTNREGWEIQAQNIAAHLDA